MTPAYWGPRESVIFPGRVGGVLPGVRVPYLGESVIPSEEVSFADVEYANQRRVSLPE